MPFSFGHLQSQGLMNTGKENKNAADGCPARGSWIPYHGNTIFQPPSCLVFHPQCICFLSLTRVTIYTEKESKRILCFSADFMSWKNSRMYQEMMEPEGFREVFINCSFWTELTGGAVLYALPGGWGCQLFFWASNHTRKSRAGLDHRATLVLQPDPEEPVTHRSSWN